MTCIVCGTKETVVPGVQHNWRCIEADGWPMFACPKEFPADNSDAAAFKAAYLKALRRVKELFAARKCRHCGCTDEVACPDSCFWIEWNLCSSCIDVAKPVQMKIDIGVGMHLVSALQLACRHPDFGGIPRQITVRFARHLQDAISRCPQVAAALEEGWNETSGPLTRGGILIP